MATRGCPGWNSYGIVGAEHRHGNRGAIERGANIRDAVRILDRSDISLAETESDARRASNGTDCQRCVRYEDRDGQGAVLRNLRRTVWRSAHPCEDQRMCSRRGTGRHRDSVQRCVHNHRSGQSIEGCRNMGDSIRVTDCGAIELCGASRIGLWTYKHPHAKGCIGSKSILYLVDDTTASGHHQATKTCRGQPCPSLIQQTCHLHSSRWRTPRPSIALNLIA